jgi:Zn-finger nucleic acid-binding protein
MHLSCLKCTSILDKAMIEEVEVDHCPACGGLWLDHGEIERISRKMATEVDRLRKLLVAQPGPPAVPSEITTSCPRCTGAMKEVTLGSIRIDFCAACKGFFLDRGEIDGAIAAVSGQRMTVAQIVAAAASELPA